MTSAAAAAGGGGGGRGNATRRAEKREGMAFAQGWRAGFNAALRQQQQGMIDG